METGTDTTRLAERFGYRPPVAQLLTLGDVRGGTTHEYLALGIGPADIPELIRMAADDSLWSVDSESVEVWSSIHAWRALGMLRAEAAIGPLIKLLSRPDDDDYDDWIGEDFPDIFGQIGPAAIPALTAYLRAPGHGRWARATASGGLEKIAAAFPDTRERVVAIISGVLADITNRPRPASESELVLNGNLVSDLITLHAVEAAPIIERAFAADRVDKTMAGDLEDVQIALDLREKRDTPARNYFRESFRARGLEVPPLFGGGPEPEPDPDLDDTPGAPALVADPAPPVESPEAVARRAAAERKIRSKRAIAEQSRKQNRKRK